MAGEIAMKSIDFQNIRDTETKNVHDRLLTQINELRKKYHHLTEENMHREIIRELFETRPYFPNHFSKETLEDPDSVDSYKWEFVNTATELFIKMEKEIRPEVFLNHFFTEELDKMIQQFNYRSNYKEQKQAVLADYIGENKAFLLACIIYNIEYSSIVTGSFFSYYPKGMVPEDTRHLRKFLHLPDLTAEMTGQIQANTIPEEIEQGSEQRDIPQIKDLAILLYLLDEKNLFNFMGHKDLVIKILKTNKLRDTVEVSNSTLDSYFNSNRVASYLHGQKNIKRKQYMARVLREIANRLDRD
ncbi:MAG: hypothetical protein JNL57_13575 [Bacteroidetes bacterium]|nr:hypothetical protein [Bacteroidota bacterium]